MKSAVALPWGGTLPAGRQRVRGFAWSPVGRISRVEYSLDRGATWQPAALARAEHSARLGTVGLRVGRPARRPHDPDARPPTTGATPSRPSISWNAQGYGYNVPVPHPVKVT